MLTEYQSISDVSEGIYKEKGSKFLAYAHPIDSEEGVKELIKTYKKEYYDARHICYAYILGFDKSITRAVDDGEPPNSAGNPILGQIRSKDLTNTIIVIIRYFGGTKLGVPGLIHAYKTAALSSLENADIQSYKITHDCIVKFDYSKMNEAMKIIKDYQIEIIKNEYDAQECIFTLRYWIKNQREINLKITELES